MTEKFILLLISLTLITSCETWRSECGGQIVVENPIPGTTLYVNGGPFFRDLFAEPVVLQQTEGQIIVILVLAEEGTIVSGNRARSSVTGRLNAVEVIPHKAGTTEVKIWAEDKCSQIETTFNVTVLDTTQQK